MKEKTGNSWVGWYYMKRLFHLHFPLSGYVEDNERRLRYEYFRLKDFFEKCEKKGWKNFLEQSEGRYENGYKGRLWKEELTIIIDRKGSECVSVVSRNPFECDEKAEILYDLYYNKKMEKGYDERLVSDVVKILVKCIDYIYDGGGFYGDDKDALDKNIKKLVEKKTKKNPRLGR